MKLKKIFEQTMVITGATSGIGLTTARMAAEKGAKQIFALSTQAFNFFQQKGGYAEATADLLPPERRKKYDDGARKSKVMVKATPTPGAVEAGRVG